ncbi:hypothetical protein NVS55_02310 [Myxococcus stipitatus]
MKENETEDEFLRYRDAVSKLLSTMLLEIMNPLYSEPPELKPKELQ